MKKSILIIIGVLCLLSLFLVSCHDVNCLPDSHFDGDGHLLEVPDSANEMSLPSSVKFFVEASGSMNGLYRSGCQTEFRDDVYQIISYYLSDADKVYTLCKDKGRDGYQYSLPQFASAIKNQGFQAMGSTSITDMMQTVIENIDTLNNEVGVLISDMKFDPDGIDNINYQLGMYTTNVSRITSESKLAFSLIAATSKYYDAQGEVLAEASPYYYLIMGRSANVAKVRDDISTMLWINGNFVDNIETGMTYGGSNFELEKVRNCMKKSKEPSFVGVNPDEPCKIKLKISLNNYRWAMANEQSVHDALSFSMLHEGASVEIDSIHIDSVFIDSEKKLNRTMEASVFFSIKNLQTDCDVIEWSFNPCMFDSATGRFEQFFGATTWKDFSKTYSIENFLQGMFRAAHLSTCSTKKNYILISIH